MNQISIKLLLNILFEYQINDLNEVCPISFGTILHPLHHLESFDPLIQGLYALFLQNTIILLSLTHNLKNKL